jgi:hypothetical protein
VCVVAWQLVQGKDQAPASHAGMAAGLSVLGPPNSSKLSGFLHSCMVQHPGLQILACGRSIWDQQHAEQQAGCGMHVAELQPWHPAEHQLHPMEVLPCRCADLWWRGCHREQDVLGPHAPSANQNSHLQGRRVVTTVNS